MKKKLKKPEVRLAVFPSFDVAKSKVQRLRHERHGDICSMTPDSNGEWVRYQDYEKLKKEKGL